MASSPPTSAPESTSEGTPLSGKAPVVQPLWLPLGLGIGSAVLALVLEAILWQQGVAWHWLCLGVAGLSVGGAIFYRRQVLQEEQLLREAADRLRKEQAEHSQAKSEWESAQQGLLKEWESREKQLNDRERELERRLLVYREWEEFPLPVSLAVSEANPAEQSGLAQKDRQMIELLQKKTEVLYEKIRKNAYAVNGKLDMTLVRNDALQLAHEVAQIYVPDVTQPMLETNAELLLRGVGRASLQFLSLLEGLPIQLKDHSLSSLYSYLRTGLSVYSTYRMAEPYWPYLNTAYYLGRFALGANPLTLSAWWFAGALSKQGAKMLVSHLVNRQAIAMLGNAVRIIGFEVANLYGGDFRHRDPNWIYAAELTQLISQFPLSRESLAAALREISTLELRSEYDRVFLCRCLAAQKGAKPENYHAATMLSVPERRAIASRLEKFLLTYVHGKTADRLLAWRTSIEERLGVKLTGAGTVFKGGVREQQQDAIRSLASFLLAMKECEPDSLASELSTSSVMAELSADEKLAALKALQENPPYFFEYADVDPMSDLTGKYLRDLARLHVQRGPRDKSLTQAVVDTALYLGKTEKEAQQILADELQRVWQLHRKEDATATKLPMEVSLAILDLLEPGNKIGFVYGLVTVEPPGEFVHKSETVWLVGVGNRLVAMAMGNEPRLLWHSEVPVKAGQKKGYLSSSLRLLGGEWNILPAEGTNSKDPTAIVVSASAIGAYANYLGPLLNCCKLEPNSSAE
ncbi:MAG: hypothetical protein U0894_03385 [Pirellulales bacterium]